MNENLTFSQPLRDVRLATAEELARDTAAYERGRREAEQSSSETLEAQRRELIEPARQVLAALQQAMPRAIEDCRHSLASLALEVAQKLVAGMPISAEVVEAAVLDALKHVEQTTECTVLLHPDDLALFQTLDANGWAANGAGATIHFEGSPHISRGGCLVKTRFGVVDARRETKLEQLQEAIES
jgi:flagellar assembly protein FliH